MIKMSGPRLLQSIVDTLVENFGVERVQKAIDKTALKPKVPKSTKKVLSPPTPDTDYQPTILDDLDKLLERDPHKYRLILGFYEELKARNTLPDAQDIRHFAQLIGIKRISGKSRKDMIVPLIRFLIEQSIEDLTDHIDRAASVSERQRQQGFSLLTDKLLGK